MQYPKTRTGTISKSDVIVDAGLVAVEDSAHLQMPAVLPSKLFFLEKCAGVADRVFLEPIRLPLQRDRVYTVSGVHDLRFCCSFFNESSYFLNETPILRGGAAAK